MPELVVPAFSQRDPRWGKDRHGTSNMTLAQTGCTVTIVSSLLAHAGYKIDPGKLNALLTESKGYAYGNLIIWTVVSQLFPKAKFQHRHYQYSNDLARAWIDAGKMPIVEVSAAPIGGSPGGKHWVGFVGNRKSLDSWTGTIKDTSTWNPTGLALFEYTPSNQQGDPDMKQMYKGYDLNNPDSMKVAVDVLVRLQQGEFIDTPVHLQALEQQKQDHEQKMMIQLDLAYNAGLEEGRKQSGGGTGTELPPKLPENAKLNGITRSYRTGEYTVTENYEITKP